MIVFERRASSILYNLLLSLEDRRPFLLPVNVCPIVPLTFLKAGRPFCFVDISEPDLALDRDQCLERLRASEEGFAGILYVRTYGTESDADAFFQAAHTLVPDLLLIDDRCLCPPDLSGHRLSALADATLFSTGRAKHVDLGSGGFAHLGEGVPYRRHHGTSTEAAIRAIDRQVKQAVARGAPFEGTDGEWLDLSVPDRTWESYERAVRTLLPEIAEHKRRLNAIYTAALPEEIRLPARFQSWRFHIVVPRPDRLVERLFAEGLFASRHYASLGGIFSRDTHFPEAQRLQQGIVNLFNDRSFDEARAERAAARVLLHLIEHGH